MTIFRNDGQMTVLQPNLSATFLYNGNTRRPGLICGAHVFTDPEPFGKSFDSDFEAIDSHAVTSTPKHAKRNDVERLCLCIVEECLGLQGPHHFFVDFDFVRFVGWLTEGLNSTRSSADSRVRRLEEWCHNRHSCHCYWYPSSINMCNDSCKTEPKPVRRSTDQAQPNVGSQILALLYDDLVQFDIDCSSFIDLDREFASNIMYTAKLCRSLSPDCSSDITSSCQDSSLSTTSTYNVSTNNKFRPPETTSIQIDVNSSSKSYYENTIVDLQTRLECYERQLSLVPDLEQRLETALVQAENLRMQLNKKDVTAKDSSSMVRHSTLSNLTMPSQNQSQQTEPNALKHKSVQVNRQRAKLVDSSTMTDIHVPADDQSYRLVTETEMRLAIDSAVSQTETELMSCPILQQAIHLVEQSAHPHMTANSAVQTDSSIAPPERVKSVGPGAGAGKHVLLARAASLDRCSVSPSPSTGAMAGNAIARRMSQLSLDGSQAKECFNFPPDSRAPRGRSGSSSVTTEVVANSGVNAEYTSVSGYDSVWRRHLTSDSVSACLSPTSERTEDSESIALPTVSDLLPSTTSNGADTRDVSVCTERWIETITASKQTDTDGLYCCEAAEAAANSSSTKTSHTSPKTFADQSTMTAMDGQNSTSRQEYVTVPEFGQAPSLKRSSSDLVSRIPRLVADANRRANSLHPSRPSSGPSCPPPMARSKSALTSSQSNRTRPPISSQRKSPSTSSTGSGRSIRGGQRGSSQSSSRTVNRASSEPRHAAVERRDTFTVDTDSGQLSSPSIEMVTALHRLTELDSSEDDSESMERCKSVVQREWFRLTSRRDSRAPEVANYLLSTRNMARDRFCQKPTKASNTRSSDTNDSYVQDLMTRLVNLSDVNGNTALHYATSFGNYDVVAAILSSRPAVLDANIVNRAGYTAAMLIPLAPPPTSPAHIASVERLVRLANITIRGHTTGQTALMLAAIHGRADVVQLMIDTDRACKTDPDRNSLVDFQDRDGSTALMCAVHHGHPDVVQVILASNPDLHITDGEGCNALSLAASRAEGRGQNLDDQRRRLVVLDMMKQYCSNFQ